MMQNAVFLTTKAPFCRKHHISFHSQVRTCSILYINKRGTGTLHAVVTNLERWHRDVAPVLKRHERLDEVESADVAPHDQQIESACAKAKSGATNVTYTEHTR